MSAVAVRSGVYRVVGGALVRERPFEDVADKCKCVSASGEASRPRGVQLINASAFRIASDIADKCHGISAEWLGGCRAGPELRNAMAQAFENAPDKCHDKLAERLKAADTNCGLQNVMTLEAVSDRSDKVHELSAADAGLRKFMNFRGAS